MFVALEARSDPDSRMGWDEDRAFFFPIEFFLYFAMEDGSKVTYEDMETFGYPLGTDGDYDFSGKAVKHARSKKEEFQRRIDGIEEHNLQEFEEE